MAAMIRSASAVESASFTPIASPIAQVASPKLCSTGVGSLNGRAALKRPPQWGSLRTPSIVVTIWSPMTVIARSLPLRRVRETSACVVFMSRTLQSPVLDVKHLFAKTATNRHYRRRTHKESLWVGHKKAPASGDTGARRMRPPEKGQNTKPGQASGLRGGGQDRRAGRTPLPSQTRRQAFGPKQGWQLQQPQHGRRRFPIRSPSVTESVPSTNVGFRVPQKMASRNRFRAPCVIPTRERAVNDSGFMA